MDQILRNEKMSLYLSQGQMVDITVTGDDDQKSEEMLTCLQSCTASFRNVSCRYGNRELLAEAHEAGMSFGKYKDFLELQALDPDITLEEVRDMNMRQIHDLQDQLSENAENKGEDCDSEDKKAHRWR